MRAALTALVLVFCLPTAGATEDDPSRWWVRCGGPFQLCGYVAGETATPRLPFRYEAAKPFRNGLAAVRIDGRWGYIDESGRLVIDPAYTDAAPFFGPYAEVHVGEAAGLIDRGGRMVVRPRFKHIIPYAGDVFIAAPLAPPPYGNGHLASDGNPDTLSSFGPAGLYHVRRGWVTDQDFQFTGFDPARGLVWAGRRDEDRRDVWGLMRIDGSWQVSPRYSHVQWLREGRAIVRSLPDTTLPPAQRQGAVLSGAVNEDGELMVPLERRWLGYSRGGYLLANLAGRAVMSDETTAEPSAGLVKPDGALLAGRYFDAVDVPEGGLLPRGRLGEVWYSIDPDGRLLPDQLDGTTVVECSGGVSFIRRGDLVEVQRPDGQTIGRFARGHQLERHCPGPFPVQRGDRWFFLMPDGSLLGGEEGFENSYSFSGDYAAVQVEGKWGVIDRQGQFTVTPRFE